MVEITDPDVLAKSGKRFHPIVGPGRAGGQVSGTAFKIGAEEVADYKRVTAPLASGRTAWMYVKA